MAEYFFTTEQMCVGYNGKPLIREIEIRVRKGEILTLIGPNGAGKSTILKSITGQLKMIGGRAVLDEKNMAQVPAKELARRLAVVLTERIDPELMTCKDVVAMGRYPYTGVFGLPGKEDEEKIWNALMTVHAEELADRPFTDISDGQRQRILLAKAICQDPELIILDEPTSFLDIRHKLEFLTILKKMVKEQQVSVIMSLHELDLAERISDQVLCVRGDKIARYGTPQEIFQESFIKELYDLTTGSFHEAFQTVELPAPSGDPDVFVIAGGGSGISLFRRLAREGIPFAAGILHKNDVDYLVGSALASTVIAEESFEPISEGQYEKAKAVLSACRQVYVTLSSFGSINSKNAELLEEAKRLGIPVVEE